MDVRHQRIDDDPPCGRLTFCLTHDLTGNGRPDVIVGGMGRPYKVDPMGKNLKLRLLPVVGDVIKRLETNVFWYENPGWERHDVAKAPELSVGGSLGDLTGDGTVDLVAGQNLDPELYWFEQPADPRDEWERRLITDDFVKYHDTAVADVDDDGENEVVVLSQQSETIFYYDVPEDPRQSPWPAEYRTIVAEDIHVEGLAVTDVDGDGRTEIVAGPNVFHRERDGAWRREQIATGWEWTRVQVADVDGDGEDEIVLAEGDRPYNGDDPGRVGWFDPPHWEEHLLADDLFCPHTLQVTNGDGPPDVYAAEMSLGENPNPTHYWFRNDGAGNFERTVLADGVETHEAKLADLDGDGTPDVVGKSYYPDHHVDAWLVEE